MKVERLFVNEIEILNNLQNDNIIFVGDLVQKNNKEALALFGSSQEQLNIVKNNLAEIGLHINMELSNWPPENIEADIEYVKKYSASFAWLMGRYNID